MKVKLIFMILILASAFILTQSYAGSLLERPVLEYQGYNENYYQNKIVNDFSADHWGVADCSDGSDSSGLHLFLYMISFDNGTMVLNPVDSEYFHIEHIEDVHTLKIARLNQIKIKNGAMMDLPNSKIAISVVCADAGSSELSNFVFITECYDERYEADSCRPLSPDETSTMPADSLEQIKESDEEEEEEEPAPAKHQELGATGGCSLII